MCHTQRRDGPHEQCKLRQRLQSSSQRVIMSKPQSTAKRNVEIGVFRPIDEFNAHVLFITHSGIIVCRVPNCRVLHHKVW